MKKIILAGTFLALAIPIFVLAAETKGILYFSAPANATVGKNLVVTVMADPKGQLLDTVRAVVKFSKDTLEVKSVSLAPGFSVADPDSFYSNGEGLVSYAGGIPGGTAQSATFATITFTVKKAGQASIAFDQQSIMLSGGTNMLSGTGQALVFTINEPASPQPETQEVTKPAITQNNTQLKSSPKIVTKSENGTEAAAAVEVAVIPIVKQTSLGSWGPYLAANKWFFLFWLLLAVNIILLFKKKISLLMSKYKYKFGGLAVLVVVIMGTSFGTSVTAAEAVNGTTVHPSKETVTIASGKRVKKSLLIVNSANTPLALKVSVRNVKATDESGGIAFYESEDDFPATSWLFPQYEVVVVKPLDSEKMEYIVSADKDMPGQGYAGAIVFELYDAKTKKTSGEPFGTLINLNVLAKGITTGGNIKSFNSPLLQFADPVKFNFTVKNSSNSNLSLAGNVVFTSLFGKEVGRFKTGQLDVYPLATRNFKFEWSDAPIFGIYVGNITLIDSIRKDNIISSWTLLVFLPWQKLLIALLGMAVIIGIGMLLYRAYTKKRTLNISVGSALLQSGKDMLDWASHAISSLRRKEQIIG